MRQHLKSFSPDHFLSSAWIIITCSPCPLGPLHSGCRRHSTRSPPAWQRQPEALRGGPNWRSSLQLQNFSKLRPRLLGALLGYNDVSGPSSAYHLSCSPQSIRWHWLSNPLTMFHVADCFSPLFCNYIFLQGKQLIKWLHVNK